MCGRYQFSIEEKELREIVKAAEEKLKKDEEIHTGEIFITNRVAILTPGKEPIPEPALWGFPKSWEKGVIFNTRDDSLFDEKKFRGVFLKCAQSQRCIIPASGFFEWKKTDSEKNKKQKYLFDKSDSPVLYMAGIYNEYNGEKCFSIITKKANNYVKEIHSRMPVILSKEEVLLWLNDSDKTKYFIETASPHLQNIAV